LGLVYDYPKREKACATKPLNVRLDGRSVGEIRKVTDGYQYFAKGEKKGGEIFNSVPDVQNSLLATQPSKADKKNEKPETIEDQSADMIKKIKKELKKTNGELEKAKVLLEACFDLFQKQHDSEDVLNLLSESVTVGETETDGHSIHEDIGKILDGE
jgi:methyltransferase-like protein